MDLFMGYATIQTLTVKRITFYCLVFAEKYLWKKSAFAHISQRLLQNVRTLQTHSLMKHDFREAATFNPAYLWIIFNLI